MPDYIDLQAQPRGFALLCDIDGRIRRVIRDDLALFRVDGGVASVLEVVDVASADKARRFLAEIRTHGAAFFWELNVPMGGQLTPLHFAGSLTPEGVLIIGARSRNGIAQLYQELIRINNEQMNALREAIKEQQAQSLLQMERDSALYDELSRLNNELANMQRELAKKNAELEQLNQEKNRFLGMAAHDLRTPLGIILTYSEFLADEVGQKLNEEQQEFLTIIRQSSAFMLKLVDDLLDISTIEAGRLSLDLQPTDLAGLVERSVALHNVLSAKKSVIISVELAGDLPQVMLDAAKFEQVLNNLLSNAAKFSPPGARVRVRLARRGDEAVLSVADQGPGIPAGEFDRLFKPFVWGKAQGTAGEKSTGLGLTIARRVVESHGGRIWAESQEGRGSTFYVALPLHRSSDN